MGHRRYDTSVVTPFMPDDEKLAAIREGLPAAGAGIYLNTGSAGPLPAETARAMADQATWELSVGRGHIDSFLDALVRLDEARAAVAAIVGAGIDTVALTHSVTDGMNIAAWSIDWRPGDRAVTTTHEHPDGVGGLQMIRDRFGTELELVDVAGLDDATILASFDRAIVPGTRLVVLSHVLWTTGARLPVRQVAEIAHTRGALVVVDGTQAAGAIPVSVEDLGADFYAVPAQTWLLGPEGMGALYCAPEFLEQARPAFAGWLSFETFDAPGTAVLHADARRFQGTNFHRPSVLGMARSCGWLSMYVGLDWIHRRGTSLALRTARALAAIPGVEVLTPLDRMATLVTFRISGWFAEAALDELGARVFAIAQTLPALDAIRISVGFYNTEEELARFAESVALLASHSPQTLPPRRRLTVLGSEG
jgi:L-cysteine/cystine lyase